MDDEEGGGSMGEMRVAVNGESHLIGNRKPPVSTTCEPKEGRYLIAHAHELTMISGLPPLIGSPWTSADGFRCSLN
jgi:hypothetical protein